MQYDVQKFCSTILICQNETNIVCQNIQFTQLRSSVAVMNNIQDLWNHQIEDVTNENTDLANKNGDVNNKCVSAYFTNAGV